MVLRSPSGETNDFLSDERERRDIWQFPRRIKSSRITGTLPVPSHGEKRKNLAIDESVYRTVAKSDLTSLLDYWFVKNGSPLTAYLPPFLMSLNPIPVTVLTGFL